jgi:hypothetical protein
MGKDAQSDNKKLTSNNSFTFPRLAYPQRQYSFFRYDWDLKDNKKNLCKCEYNGKGEYNNDTLSFNYEYLL